MEYPVSQLKLKYFDNLFDFVQSDKEFLENKGHKFLYEYDERLYSFIEFEIDGEYLHKLLWKGKSRGFLSINVGLLGLISKAYDELIIRYLLKKEISKSTVISVYEGHNEKLKDSTVINRVHQEFNKESLIIYACRACLDCTLIRLHIGKHEDHYSWYFKGNLTLIFEKEAYEKELLAYLHKIRNNVFTQEESLGLYQF